jgi:hypothetical protein
MASREISIRGVLFRNTLKVAALKSQRLRTLQACEVALTLRQAHSK